MGEMRDSDWSRPNLLRSDWLLLIVASYTTHFLAIAATTIAEIELFLSQRSLSLRSLEGGFHMIAIIAALAELLFFSAIRAMVAIIWKPGFRGAGEIT